MKTSEKLIARIKKEFPELNISESAKYKRLYPGHIQRFNGAWNWHIIDIGSTSVGSQWTVKDLIESPGIGHSYRSGDFHIYPVGGDFPE